MRGSEINVTFNVFPVSKGRTKYEILSARLAEMREFTERMESEIAWMDRTEFGRECSGCGEMLATEKDFASHFIVTDERYTNLGECPHKRR